MWRHRFKPAGAGQVEKNVRDARHRLWQVAPVFPDLAALNDWLEERCKQLWTETAHGTLPGSIADVWAAEKPALMPLTMMFDGFVEARKRVSPTCLITFDRNRYSVPASFANRPVSLRIYPERLVVVAEGHVICTHERIIDRSHRKPGRFIYDWRHYLALAVVSGARTDGATAGNSSDQWRTMARSSANLERCGMARPSSRCPNLSESFRRRCCASPAGTAKWSISCPW